MFVLIVGKERIPGSLYKVLRTCGIQHGVCEALDVFNVTVLRDHPDLVLCYKLSSQELRTVRETKEKAYPTLPLFVISQEGSALDRVVALQNGITQYYLQPFSYTRLIYDIGTTEYTTNQTAIKAVGPFHVDPINQAIAYRGTVLFLSKKQYALLNLLLSRHDRVVSRVQIWEAVWGLEQYPLANCIDALVSRVRKQLPQAISCKIEQVYGIGYRLLLGQQLIP